MRGALSRQINKQKVSENNLCKGNKVFVKYQAQGVGSTLPPFCVLCLLNPTDCCVWIRRKNLRLFVF